MSLSISKLRERVAARFPDVEQVDDSIIRFTRKAGEAPFAVYYFDVAEDLPRTQEMLTKYQDRVVGSNYFEGAKSLQWSNYLYFVTSADRLASSQVRQAKDLIERDRSYARKFVISEDELDFVLVPPTVVSADATPRTNVLSVWIDYLVKAGLDRAILSNDDLPTRLALIESSSSKPSAVKQTPQRRTEVKAVPFIRSLQLKEFREFPLLRNFRFGAVNLIFGANGTGKTSLLEAIELFYCGRNNRNPGLPLRYELIAVLADDRTEKATNNRGLQLFRDRNLAWYGQAEVKTSNLYQSFAQFNFLDTDAAVSLSESTSHMEEDLSKLLVGPDASKTWRDIERVHDAVVGRLRELRPLELQINEELAVLVQRLKDNAQITQESDSIRARLEGVVLRIGWSTPQGEKERFAGSLLEALAELVPLAQQAAVLGWVESPVSSDSLVKYSHQAKVISEKAEVNLARLELSRKNQARAAEASKRGREALELAKQAKHLIDANLPIRAADISKQQSKVATYSAWLASLDADALGASSTGSLDVALATYHDTAVSWRLVSEGSLVSAQNEHSNFTKLRDQSLNLAQELRQVAARILRSSPKPDECPLCHTQFGPGELATHMSVGVDEHLEALGQPLISKLRESESAVRDARAAEVVSGWLIKFCERAGLSTDIRVRTVLAEVENANRTLAEAQAQLEALNKEVLALESQGLSMERLEEILARLHELAYPLAESTREAANQLHTMIEQDLAALSRTLETEMKQGDKLEQSLKSLLGSEQSGVQEIRGALSQMKERIVVTESLIAKLSDFSPAYPWPGEKPLAELVVEAESVRKVAAELQTTLGNEKQAKATYTESILRKEELEKRLKELGPRIKRFTEAQIALDKLQKEHSLTDAMKVALQHNRVAIEAIFSRIHSPAEFRGLGSDLATLVRRTNGRDVTLSQISTGQRAAFALSIFLAQNARLSVGPAVVLIDDPIAHVDDLNSLSFLDFLREIALTGRRQIFFATANDKLATLFERKFDFLGKEGFRRFNLMREALPSAQLE